MTMPSRQLVDVAMRQNRGVAPDDPEFFRHLHALEDFVRAVRHLD